MAFGVAQEPTIITATTRHDDYFDQWLSLPLPIWCPAAMIYDMIYLLGPIRKAGCSKEAGAPGEDQFCLARAIERATGDAYIKMPQVNLMWRAYGFMLLPTQDGRELTAVLSCANFTGI
jgi:hypothetical protein